MPQFPITTKVIENEHAFITDKSMVKHIFSVLRLKQNDELLLIDENEIAYKTTIIEANKEFIKAKILHAEKSKRKLNFQLDLLQCTLKSGAMEFVVQKMTELGTKNLYVMPSFRSVPKFDNKDIKNKIEKWHKIADESCKQCERADKPDIHYLNNFNELKEHAQNYDVVLACIERSTEKTLKEALRGTNYKKILVIIGPEGGFENNEIDFFKDNAFEMVSISNLIYRAETASISALAGVIYEYEL